MSRNLSEIDAKEKLEICKAIIAAGYLGKGRDTIVQNFDITEEALQELEAAVLTALQSVVEPSEPELDEFEKITQQKAEEFKQKEPQAEEGSKRPRKPSDITDAEKNVLNQIFSDIKNFNKKKGNENIKIYPSLGAFEDCYAALVIRDKIRDISSTAIKAWYLDTLGILDKNTKKEKEKENKPRQEIGEYLKANTDLSGSLNQGRNKKSISEKLGYISPSNS